MASSLIMTAATLLLLLSLASLFFGATPFQLSGSPPSLLKPSDSPVVFCSCALPDAYPDSGRLPPDLELHSPNLTQGTGAARVSHSRTLPFSPVISIGQWLRLDMRNTTFRITIQVTRPQLPEVTLPNLNDYRGQVALWYSTVLAAMLGRLTLCLSWLTDFFGAVFRVVETVVIVSLYWTVVLFWRCVLSSPFRMAVWLVTPCVLFCTWGMTCVNLPVRIAAGIVTAPILTLYFCCVVFLRCVGRFTRLTRNITTSCMSWVSSTRTKTVQSLRTLPTSATSTFAQMRNLKSGGEAQVIPGRDNFTAGWERAVPLPNAQSPLELHAAPPKRCIGSCLDKNRKHVGYFTLVKLMGGGVGVIAPFHVLDDTEYISGRDASMSLEQLTQVYEDTKGDLAIFTGPASMGSLLGMKAVPLLCADMVRKSQVSLYTERDGGWRVQSASIVGAQDGFLAVVSQTLPGDSGLPLFDQRNRVVAIHVGHFGSRRVENMASVVLPVPGLTAPDYAIYKPVGETLYVADRVFEIAERLEAGQAREIWVGGKQWKTVIGSSSIAVLRNPEFDHSAGKLGAWGDIEDDEVAPEPAHFEKATSGNGSPRSTPGKQSAVNAGSPASSATTVSQGTCNAALPPKQKNTQNGGRKRRASRAERMAQMSPEQLSAFREKEKVARRERRKRKNAAKPRSPSPCGKGKEKAAREVAKAIWPQFDMTALQRVLEKAVEKKVASMVQFRPRRNPPLRKPAKPQRTRPSDNSSTGSTAGAPAKKSPRASGQSAPVASPHRPLPVRKSVSGGALELRPQTSSRKPVGPMIGQIQVPLRN
ncbi:P1 protein [Black pepper virus E]|nr:P1 protein [Black pepper virus E]